MEDERTKLIQKIDASELIHSGSEFDVHRMPPILAGQSTRAMELRVERFYFSVAQIFAAWVKRRPSLHTQRAYEQDVMMLVAFLKLKWPEQATELLAVSVADVMTWRDQLERLGLAPKTINRRISSVSSFYKYLHACASEMRLPIVVPNPAHAQFIGRASQDAVEETKALTASKARQLMELPKGEGVLAYRDRAVLKVCLYTGVRIGTVARLRVEDFHQQEDGSTLSVNEKGDKRRTIGIHFAAAEAIAQYIDKAEIKSGPLFRPRSGPRSHTLAARHMTEKSMYLLIVEYLKNLPGATHVDEHGHKRCLFWPHSLRATAATLLLDSGVDILKVQQLLGHRHVTTTQVYDKRRRTTKESASHDMPL